MSTKIEMERDNRNS